MKTVNFFAKAFVALTLAFAAQAPAQAQLGNLLNKAREVVTDQAGKAAGQVTAKSAQEVLGEAPARPWVLDEAQSGNMERLIGALGGMNEQKTKEFGEQISARAEYDAKLLAGMEDKTIIEDEELKKQAKKELELADKFYGLVVKSGATYGPVGMKKKFPTFIDETALPSDKIYVSAGMRGVQLIVSPEPLCAFVDGKFADLIR